MISKTELIASINKLLFSIFIEEVKIKKMYLQLIAFLYEKVLIPHLPSQ